MSDSPDGSTRRSPDRVEEEEAPGATADGVVLSTRARLPFPIVGIGASAGGLEALEMLTRRLVSCSMAFVIVQHLAPGHASMLAEILQRGSTLPVVTIEDGMRISPATIYVAPPLGRLFIEGGQLRLSGQSEPPGGRRSIDGFFRSLASAAGPIAIGVVLSGWGEDGTLGLKAIKGEGGITFAQDPSTATQTGMPQSAIDAGSADSTLSPEEIGDELMRLAVHPYIGTPRQAKVVDAGGTAKILARLKAARGVDFSQYKPGTIERRIVRRMAVHKLDHVEGYLAHLESSPAELQSLYDDLLIGVTSFFRDSEPFDALKRIILPKLVEGRAHDSSIRIWVAGCSSGEEAYSLAIVLLEFLGERGDAFPIQIFATDVDDSALARARLGVYPRSIEDDVSAERLQRFFVRVDTGYQVARHVREAVVFARHNLGKDPPFSRLDVVTCRNVLIYMQAPLQKRVLRIFHYALNPGAYLLLGTSESVTESTRLFTLVERKRKVYAKKNVSTTSVVELAFSGRVPPDEALVRLPPPRAPATLTQLADRKMIEKYGRPGVLVDDKLDVVQYRGRTGEYLEAAPGPASFNLLKLVRPEFLIALRSAVQTALAEGIATTSPVIQMPNPHGPRLVTVEALPLPEVGPRKYVLVVFNEHPSSAAPSGEGEPAPARDAPGADPHPRIAVLERELAANKEYLQSTIEELEAANEELQSANEELQSSNEELQSINEELETSKEEMQSTNEELATVNDELQNRMAQLSLVNDDLQNILSNTGTPFVILGSDLRIRRFSTAAERLLSLIPSDVGRPVTYLRNVMSAREIDATAAEALSTVSLREQRVRSIDGSWYMMKMVPYVTMDHAIRGLVLEFVKTPPPAAGADGYEIPELAQQVLATLPHPVMLLDRQLRLVWANRIFFETFCVSPAALKRPLVEAWGSATEPAELWAFLQELISERPTRDVLVDGAFGRTRDHAIRFSGQIVPYEGDRPLLAVVFMHDV